MARELLFWGQATLVCFLPIGGIYFLADDLGLPNPFREFDPQMSHASMVRADLYFLIIVPIFYAMRQIDKVAYGLAECLFALSGFDFFYLRIDSNYSYQAFLMTTGGFIYVGVRGVDNIVTGAKRHYADPQSDPRWFWW